MVKVAVPRILTTAAWIALYFLFMLILAFYYPNHGDESIWAYQALMVNDGMTPGISFATHEPLALLWTYGAIYKYISQSQEAVRLVTAILCVFQNIIIYFIVLRIQGRFWAFLALALVTSNFPYMYDIITANSMTFSFAAVMAVYGALVLIRSERVPKYLLIGVALGVAIATRLPTGLVSLVVAAYALWGVRRGEVSLRQGILNIAAAAVPAILLCVPDLLIFASAPKLIMFERVGLANALYTPAAAHSADVVWLFVAHCLRVIWLYVTLSSRFTVGQNFAIFGGLAIVAVFWGWDRMGQGAARRIRLPSELIWAWAVVAALVVAYLSTWMVRVGSYLNPATPFLVIIVTVSLARVIEAHREVLSWLRLAFVVFAAPFALMGLAELGREVVFRHSGGTGQKITTAGVGCWLETATGRDDLVLDLWPSAVAVADRRMPRGFEKAGQIRQVYALGPEYAGYMPGALTQSQVVGLVKSQSVALINYGDDDMMEWFPGIKDAVRENYEFIGNYGGTVSPYRFYASRKWLAARTTPLPKLPREANTQAHWYGFSWAGRQSFIADVAHDLGQSMATFPADVSASVARLFGLSWERRCRFVMDGEGIKG